MRLQRAAAPGGTGAAAVTTLGAVSAAAPATRPAFSAAKHRG